MQVSEVQLSINASHEIMKEKLKNLEERFEQENNENIENLKLTEIKNGNIKKQLRDLEDRSRRDNLHFHDITEYENKS